jgi:chromosome partitioning protein
MAVIAVINRKGGSGKSTLATHLAAWFAQQGLPVVLGDVDRQQSTQTWLRRRAQQATGQRARLMGCNVDPRNVVRPPLAGQHMVLDTPGGLRGFDLARVVMYADAVLMPVCNSAFDRESAADCVAELRTLPRVASGRCRLAAVGMRIDARTKAEAVLRAWAAGLDLGFLGVLRDAQAYVRCVEDGLTLFDLPPAKVAQDLAQWQPILDWLAPLARPAAAASGAHGPQAAARVHSSARLTGRAAEPSALPAGERLTEWFDAPSSGRAARPAVPPAALPVSLLRDAPATQPQVQAPAPVRQVQVRAAIDAAAGPSTIAGAAPATVVPASALPSVRAASDPAPATLSRSRGVGGRPLPLRRPATPATAAAPRSTRIGRLLGALPIPRFLQRAP